MRDPTKLSRREITTFLHNAQLGSMDLIEDYKIPAIHSYTKHLYHLLIQESSFTHQDLIAVMTSVAWALHTGGGNGKEETSRHTKAR